MKSNIYKLFLGGLILLASISFTHAQVKNTKAHQHAVPANSTTGFNEEEIRKEMKMEGLSDSLISSLIVSHKEIFDKNKNFKNANLKLISPLPVPFASCNDMGAETGWGGWSGSEGSAVGNSPTWSPLLTPPGPTNANTAFVITTGTGNDPCSVGAPATSPLLPLVAPGFGNSSIHLGVDGQPGAFAERIVYSLNVTAQDTNFVYAYACVIQDAGSGHSPTQQPYVSFCMKDANGNNIPCGCFKYTGGPALPGFFPAKGFNCNAFNDVYYKPWTMVGVNLSNYVGQTITITIENVDCVPGAHFAHSYWDFKCGVFTTTPGNFCAGQSVSITAPSDPGIAYSYNWFQNGQPYTGAPSATAQTIVPFPQAGDTFSVQLIQPSGCNFYISYVPQVIAITPNFSSNGVCGAMNFTDLSTAPNNVPITSWNWSFPSGTPATSTVQNPTNISYPPGTYTVTLIATSQNGCKDTISLPITVLNSAVASFTTTPVCEGIPVQFTNTTPGAGLTYAWNFPGGTPATSTIANPLVSYPAGTYSATLNTALGSCTATVTNTFVVNPNPSANFAVTPVCFNNPSQFTNQSTGATIYNWNFGDGNTSTLQSPSHTYGTAGSFSVSLIVSNASGCKDTVKVNTTINPLPVANFSSTPVCLGTNTCYNDLSTISVGTISNWSWNFGDPASGAANTSAMQSPCHIYSGPGTFSVILTVTSDSGCQNTVTLPTTVNPPPVAGINSQNVCLNALTNFTDGSVPAVNDPISSWNWNFGDASAPGTVQNPGHTFVSGGTYTVTLIVTSQNGCKDTTDKVVIVYLPPVANFSHPDSGCAPVCVSYTDLSTSTDGSISFWQWSFPGGSVPISNIQNPQNICYTTPGQFNVSLVVTSSFGCVDSITLPMIDVYPWPNADFCVAPMQAPSTDPIFNFCDLWSTDVVQWNWDFGDNTSDSVNTDPIHSYSAAILGNDFYNFNVCLHVQNQYGCWDTICKVVELIPEFTFYIPNTFTPNSDNMNEVFFGKGRGIKEYEIWLFDRWGNQIWNCEHADKNTNWDNLGQDGLSSYCKWNGEVVNGGLDMNGRSGQLAQEDVYVWKVALIDIFDKRHSYVGHVNVVR